MEQLIIKKVTVKPQINVIEVLWEKQFIVDSEVVATTNVRSSYMSHENARFLAELGDDASAYVNLITWDI